MSREDVEFPTLDGLILRGWLYPAAKPAPAIIMTQGFNTVKEMLLPDVAVWFQRHGLTVLLYDNRTIGASDGNPRNEIDCRKLVEDYHDAFSYLSTHPLVDPDRITYFGNSFSAMVALVAAALDKRAAAVISIAPITNYSFDPTKLSAILALAMQDRASRLAGNEALHIPFLDETGENPVGWGEKNSLDVFKKFLDTEIFTNRTTVQSYYHMLTWQPYGVMGLVSPTPVMVVTPGEDSLSLPEKQRELFGMFDEPKRFLLVPGKEHIQTLTGESTEEVLGEQLRFLREVLGF
ncbi:Alpha/Beta hydrolase protein [Aspergillus carlsbadensis]|nr:Alpha/Beta hydrolase protein [Aspergillus carlsbadensis]